MSTTGGGNLQRVLAKARAAQPEVVVDVGFKGPVASLQHEFGNPRSSLPERPAIRAATRDLEDITVESKATDHEQFVEAGLLMRDALKNSYLNFEGTPLSARQQQRKAGDEVRDGSARGCRGPEIVEHVSCGSMATKWDDGTARFPGPA